jgi:hypothetical protein
MMGSFEFGEPIMIKTWAGIIDLNVLFIILTYSIQLTNILHKEALSQKLNHP